jgi:hypothetical protein
MARQARMKMANGDQRRSSATSVMGRNRSKKTRGFCDKKCLKAFMKNPGV